MNITKLFTPKQKYLRYHCKMSIYEFSLKYPKLLLDLYDQREVGNIIDIVLDNVTNMTKPERLVRQFHSFKPEETLRLEEIMPQLLEGRPVQYVLGEAWFGGLKLFVDNNVLIPRPETDELVDWIVKDSSAAIEATPTFRILDIGTGSGCIPLALKKKLFRVEMTGIDISEKALEVAKKNSDTYRANIGFQQFDFLKENKWNTLGTYNVIVSNPPYIKESEKATMHKNVLEYEPAIALFVPENDPLLFYKKIALFATTHLEPNGKVYVEINEAHGKETVNLFKTLDFTTELRKDFQGKERMLKAWK